MRLLFTLALLLAISFASKAQNFILNFEDSAAISQYFYTDSILDLTGRQLCDPGDGQANGHYDGEAGGVWMISPHPNPLLWRGVGVRLHWLFKPSSGGLGVISPNSAIFAAL